MRSFPVPIQITEDEKIFGGHLSLRQMAYLFIIGPGLGFIVAALIPFGGITTDAILFLIGFLIGAALAFVKIYDTSLDVYLWYAIKWLRSPRIYTWGE